MGSLTEFASPGADAMSSSVSEQEWDNLVECLLEADRALSAAVQAFLRGKADKEQVQQANTFAAAIHSLAEEIVQRVLGHAALS